MTDPKINNMMLNSRDNPHSKENPKSTIQRFMYPGLVLSNDDPSDGGRLIVRVQVLDRGLAQDDEKMRAFPLNSKVGNDILPKVGEYVWIIIPDVTKPYSLRLWSGPINSQYQNLIEDKFSTALSLTNEPFSAPLEPISSIPTAENLYPVKKDDKENLTTLGRENTDILHRRNKLTFRAGKNLTDKPLEANLKNPVYTQLRLFEDDSISSSVSVADYHLFISHKGQNISKTIIDDDDIKNIIEKGNSMLRGEPTIELLKMLIEYVILIHSHRQNNLSPNAEAEAAKKLLNFDLTTLLSKFHKIN